MDVSTVSAFHECILLFHFPKVSKNTVPSMPFSPTMTWHVKTSLAGVLLRVLPLCFAVLCAVDRDRQTERKTGTHEHSFHFVNPPPLHGVLWPGLNFSVLLDS